MGAAVRLVTWNIQWGRGADGRVDLARTVADARACADFDVLCLQEVAAGFPDLPGSDGGDQFAALAALLPGFTALEGTATDLRGAGTRRRFGNLLLTRLPVRQVFVHLLPWPAHEGVKSMQRCALEAVVDTAGGPLRITTTHLEYYSERQRAAQVERLRELQREGWAQARRGRAGDAADGPFAPVPRGAGSLLVGDFNFRPGAPEHARLLAPFGDGTPAYRDAWTVRHPGRPHDATVGVHDKQQWPDAPFTCDFAFASEDLAGRLQTVAVEAVTAASDHQPLLIEWQAGA